MSRELKTVRQLVANTLVALGYEPVWQDIFDISSDDIPQTPVESGDGNLPVLLHYVLQYFLGDALKIQQSKQALTYRGVSFVKAMNQAYKLLRAYPKQHLAGHK